MLSIIRHIKNQRRLAIIILLSGILSSIAGPSWPEINDKQTTPARVTAIILHDSPPTYFLDAKTRKPAGFAVDILDKVAERAGLRVDYLFAHSWKEVSRKLINGEADLCPGMGISNEREGLLAFTAPIDTFSVSFFVRAHSGKFDETTGTYTVGVIAGSVAHEYLKTRPNLHFIFYDGFTDGLFDLLAGTIDAFAGPAPTLLQLARESGVDDKIRISGKPIFEMKRAIAVRKDDIRLLDKLNVAIKGFVGQPEYQRIYVKWYGKPVVYWTPDRVAKASVVFLVLSMGAMLSWRHISMRRLNRELIAARAELERKVDERTSELGAANEELEQEIAAHMAAEGALRDSERLYRLMFENNPHPMWVYAAKTRRFLAVNDAAIAQYGYTRDEFLAMTIEDIRPPDDATLLFSRIVKIEPGYYNSGSWRHRKKDGTIIDVEVISHNMDFEGEQARVVLAHDVTERRRAEAALQESELKFRTLFESAHDAILILDLEGNFIDINRIAYERLGYTKEEMMAMHVSQLDPPHYAVQVAPRIEQLKKDGHAVVESAHRKKDGTIMPVEINARVVDFEGREVLYSIVRDITERKRAEAALKEANAKLQTLIRALPDAVFFKDTDCRYLMVNRVFEQLMGAGQEAFIGKTDEDFMPPALAEGCRKSDEALMQGGKPVALEDTIIGKDGNPIYLDSVKAPMYDSQGVLLGIVGVSRDVTKRKRAEDALKQSEEKYRELVETANSVIVTLDTEGRVTFLNTFAEQFFGFAKDELLGRNIVGTIVPPAESSGRDLERLMREVRIAPDRFRDNENENITKDGRRVWVRWANRAIVNAQGEILGILSIGNDITARKKAEEALAKKTDQLEDLNKNLEVKIQEELLARRKNEQILIQQSKLAAMGEMLGAIAHQWRQPLNVVGLVVQNMQEVYEKGNLNADYLDKSVQKAMAQIEHMSRTIDDFRNFFKPDKGKKDFDTMRAVGDVLSLLSAELAVDRITCRLTCHTHGKTFHNQNDIIVCAEKTIEGYQNEFEHVVLNLINNARDAILEKRRSGNGHEPEQGLLSFDFYNANGRIIIEVNDNGSGIPPGVIDRIFEPYFTTKDAANGTGMGLYMSKVIVEEHLNGTLTAKNNEGGATFTIALPRQQGGGSGHEC